MSLTDQELEVLDAARAFAQAEAAYDAARTFGHLTAASCRAAYEQNRVALLLAARQLLDP